MFEIEFESVFPQKRDLYGYLNALSREWSVPKKDLIVLQSNVQTVDRKYMGSHRYKDALEKTIDFTQFVRYQAPQSVAGIGVLIYRTRTKPPIRYAMIDIETENNRYFTYIIVKKGELFRYKRYAIRQNAKAATSQDQPILEDGLLDEILKYSIYFAINKNKLSKYKVRNKRGLLLTGPPGNGKTMACKWIRRLCYENSITCVNIDSGDIMDAYHKNGLEGLFHQAEVTFIDDIDISFLSRNDRYDGKIACALLSAMDGMADGDNCIRVFTTNETITELDPAFRRPGRIDKSFQIGFPSQILRHRFAQTWHEEIITNIDPQEVAEKTGGWSFAELECLKCILVTNMILEGKDWDLDKAIMEFSEGREDIKRAYERKPAGFAAAITASDTVPAPITVPAGPYIGV